MTWRQRCHPRCCGVRGKVSTLWTRLLIDRCSFRCLLRCRTIHFISQCFLTNRFRFFSYFLSDNCFLRQRSFIVGNGVEGLCVWRKRTEWEVETCSASLTRNRYNTFLVSCSGLFINEIAMDCWEENCFRWTHCLLSSYRLSRSSSLAMHSFSESEVSMWQHEELLEKARDDSRIQRVTPDTHNNLCHRGAHLTCK